MTQTATPGMMIVLEGADFSGKSTAAKYLKETLDKLMATARGEGEHVVLTREPGGTPFGEEARELFFKYAPTMTTMAQTLLINAIRCDHMGRVVMPALEAGKIVICDRFTLSTYVYQKDVSIPEHLDLESFSVPDMSPDLVVVFDVSADTILKRSALQRSDETNCFDETARDKVEARLNTYKQKLAEAVEINSREETRGLFAHNVLQLDANPDWPTVQKSLDALALTIADWCNPAVLVDVMNPCTGKQLGIKCYEGCCDTEVGDTIATP